MRSAAGAFWTLAAVSSFFVLYVFRPVRIRCSMNVLRFSLPRVFSISRNSCWSMVMLT